MAGKRAAVDLGWLQLCYPASHFCWIRKTLPLHPTWIELPCSPSFEAKEERVWFSLPFITHTQPHSNLSQRIYILGIYRSLAWTIPKWDGVQQMPDTYIHVPFSWHLSSIYLSKVLLVTQQLSQVFQAPDLLACLCFDSRPATLGKKPKCSLCCAGNGWLWCGVWQRSLTAGFRAAWNPPVLHFSDSPGETRRAGQLSISPWRTGLQPRGPLPAPACKSLCWMPPSFFLKKRKMKRSRLKNLVSACNTCSQGALLQFCRLKKNPWCYNSS